MKTKYWLLMSLALFIVAAGTFIPFGDFSQPLAGARNEVGTDVPANPVSKIVVEEFDVPPRSVKTAAPKYPVRGKLDRIEGTVVVKILVGRDGRTRFVETISEIDGYPEFTEEAIAVIPNWRFEPAMKNGKPTRSHVVIPFEFKLAAKKSK